MLNVKIAKEKMKGISPNKCSVVVFHKIQDDYQTTLDLLYKVYSSGKYIRMKVKESSRLKKKFLFVSDY